ncbi:AGRL1-like protein [Mya arenaria]|uniref:AGRL1-like protein n=1 Tax=Mya arenaria TaxID=6604 RepID=A0ABY7FCQ7_MYAAR|nr:AGRL1-like protein [Mya arenaria]
MLKAVQTGFCGTETACSNSLPPTLEKGQESNLPTLPLPLPAVLPDRCCDRCSCNITTCPIYGNCCADILDQVDFSRADDIARCANRDTLNGISIRRPVTDLLTGNTYINQFCARCNFAEETVSWLPYVKCTNDAEAVNLLQATNEDILSLLEQTVSCNIVFEKPPGNFNTSYCFKSTKDTCNFTGNWKQYDSFIDRACGSYHSPFDGYNNVFCHLCNALDTPEQCTGASIVTLFPSFSTLLDFTGDETDVVSQAPDTKCRSNQFYDPVKGECRDVTCRFPKRYSSAGVCVNRAQTLRGVAYRIYIKLTPMTALHADTLQESIDLVQGDITLLLLDLSLYRAVRNFTILFLPENNPTTTTTISDMPTQATETTLLPLPPNIYLGLPVKYVLVRVQLYLQAPETDPPFNVSSLDEILALDGKPITFISTYTDFNITFLVNFEDYSKTDFTKGRYVNMSDPTTMETLEELSILFRIQKTFYEFYGNETPPALTTRFSCPLITLTLNEIVDVDGNDYILHSGEAINAKYVFNMVTDLNDTVYQVCLDEYIARQNLTTNGPTTLTTEGQSIRANGIVTMVFTCLSVLCLLLTLLTYCIFPELRTQPGINNIGLILSLIPAQLLFQFGAGQYSVIASWSCVLIGILGHFAWLMVIFWMNVCCWHMFRSFTNLQWKSGSKVKTTAFYTLYTVSASGLFVGITVVTDHVRSNGSSVGYGDGICNLSALYLIGFTFALPVFVVIVANLVLFLMVIVKISRLPSIKSSTQSNRNYFKIYAKLATLTGVSWIFGFIFIFTNVAVFEYLFIILTNGQGVFIFVSFVANARVYRMYNGKISEFTHSFSDADGTKNTKTGSTASSSKL